MSTATVRTIRIAITLGSLTLVSFFTAQGTTGLVGAAVLGVDPDQTPVAPPPAVAAARRPEKSDQRILERNIFDSEQGSIVNPPVVEEPVPETPECPEDDPDCNAVEVDPNEIPVCDGSLRLVASVYRPRRPNWSFAAIIGSVGTSRLFRRGQAVDGRQLMEIYPEEVQLQTEAGARCKLTLFSDESGTAMAPAPMVAMSAVAMAPAASATAMGRGDAGLTAEELESGIRRQSDTQYSVNRSLLDRVLENQGQLMRTVRVIPHEENGQVVGVKTYGIRRSSLLGRLGVQNGDMLRTINGYSLTSPDSALEAYTRLRSADHLTLSVIRRGQAVTLDYTVQ